MSAPARTPYKLKRPCVNCPFRTDVPGYLRRERAAEIARALADGAEFPCHETTIENPNEEGELMRGPESQFCAGALICMEHQEAPNQSVRIAERLQIYDREQLDMSAPVARSFFEFVRHHGDAEGETEPECCCVCDSGCEAPAGMLVGGVAVPAEAEGEVHDCPSCGESVCDSCSDDEGVCRNCHNPEEDE